MPPPKVFISYSHDSDEHKKWVRDLATLLLKNGVDAKLDEFDTEPGSHLPHFMKEGLSASDRAIIICTDGYIEKIKSGQGGVGFESRYIESDEDNRLHEAKYIPCIRRVKNTKHIPPSLADLRRIDFSNDDSFDSSFAELLSSLHRRPKYPKPPLGPNPFEETHLERGPGSTELFSARFARAFPGVRGVQWFSDPAAAVDRLRVFFETTFHRNESDLIWWWRDDMNNPVHNFDILSPTRIFIDHHELELGQFAAVNGGSYFQCFLYIESIADESIGLRLQTPINDQLAKRHYALEEYGWYHGRAITRHEYDDGAAVIDGKLVELDGSQDYRYRYLTPYNLLLAPKGSPINNPSFDQRRTELLNAILANEGTLAHLAEEILRLPRPERLL